jgi:beta-1,4-N-acetylglucosaminyltransferase
LIDGVYQGNYSIFKIPRARKVGQPLRTVPLSMAFALLKSSKLFIQTWPDLVKIKSEKK